jgi:hypothetical protein
MAKLTDKAEKEQVQVKEKAEPRKQPAAPTQAHDPARDARDSALSRAVQQIEKQFGKGAVMRLDNDFKAPIARGAADREAVRQGSGHAPRQ